MFWWILLHPSSFPSEKCNFKAAVFLRFVVVFAIQQTGSAELPARVNKFLLPARLQTKILLFYNFKIFPHFRTLAMEPQFSVVKHWRWNIKTPSPLLLFHGSTSWSEIDLEVTPQTSSASYFSSFFQSLSQVYLAWDRISVVSSEIAQHHLVP